MRMGYPLHHQSCKTQSCNAHKLYLFHLPQDAEDPTSGASVPKSGRSRALSSSQASIRTGFQLNGTLPGSGQHLVV
jgi:hypothetical protein